MRNNKSRIHNYRGELWYIFNQFALNDKIKNDIVSYIKVMGYDGIKYESDKDFEGDNSWNYVIYNKNIINKINENIHENIDVSKYRNIKADIWSDDIFSSLLDVGIKKAVGYLPLETILKYGGKQAKDDFIKWASENNLKYHTFKKGYISIGALYIWDENMLKDILNEYKDVLLDAGVPITPDEYIKYIHYNVVYDHKYPLAYIAIGKTFNDKRFR